MFTVEEIREEMRWMGPDDFAEFMHDMRCDECPFRAVCDKELTCVAVARKNIEKMTSENE